MHVTNTLEEVVPEVIDRLTTDHEHIRGCEECQNDIFALTLTTLQPGYSSTDMGRILKRIDVEKARGKARIAVAVLAAIDVVKQKPHHEA